MIEDKFHGDPQIMIIRTRQELMGIIKPWEDLQKAESNPIPNVDPLHYISELEGLGLDAEPQILCLYQGERIEAMLIGRRQLAIMPIRLGYATLFKPRLKSIHIFHGGFLGRQNDRSCSSLIMALVDCLNRGESDVVMFDHFPRDSLLYSVIRRQTSLFAVVPSPRIDGHWTMRFPRSLNDFYATKSGKVRQNLRREIRKLEKSYEVCMRIYSDAEGLEEGISDAARISSKTYQYAIEGGFVDNLQMRKYLLLAANQHWLRIYIYYINNEPAAFEWGIAYKGTFFLRAIGFDPKWRDWSVGTVLFLRALEALCEEGNISEMDFGFGDAEYKKIYGDARAETRSFYLYANRFYPRVINIMQLVIVGIWIAGVHVAQKLGLERKIKRIWRDRLRDKMAEVDKDMEPHSVTKFE